MVAVAIVSAVASGVAAYESSQARKQQANLARSTANYNAKVDEANAQQLALDANANIQRQRTENKAYLSAQLAAYAASGILSGTGSPLAVQATTAGRQEMDIQEYWRSVNEKRSTLLASAAEGRYEGYQQADIYQLQSNAEIFKGIGSMASSFGGIYSGASDNVSAGKSWYS